jgi:hypothetical protein
MTSVLLIPTDLKKNVLNNHDQITLTLRQFIELHWKKKNVN